MNTTTTTTGQQAQREAAPYDCIFGLGWLFRWIDRHPRTASALLWLMCAALAWVVFTYDFTIPAYK